MQRLKSSLNKTRISAIIAQIIAVLSMVGFWEAIGVTEDIVGKVIAGIMQIFVLLGIFDNNQQKTNTEFNEDNDNDNNAVL